MPAPFGSREEAFNERVLEMLDAMSEQYPSLSAHVDLWRPAVVNRIGYLDQQTEVWIRLDEAVPAFFVETMERWYDKEVGIVKENFNYIVLPSGYELEPDDHVLIDGTPWMVIQSAEQAGIAKIKVDKLKSRFIMPARYTPTYRQLGMKARIA